MNEPRRAFDWLAFLAGVVGIVVLGALWLADSVRRHNRTSAIAAVTVCYVILPTVAYLYTRHSSAKPVDRSDWKRRRD